MTRKVLEATAGESIDPSQAARIITLLFEEDAAAAAAFEAGCGVGWKTLAPELEKLPPPKRTERIVALCKVDAERLGNSQAQNKLNFAAVALSVVVEKLLEKRGGISQAERGLARHLVTLQRVD
jgi:hypothetical protein